MTGLTIKTRPTRRVVCRFGEATPSGAIWPGKRRVSQRLSLRRQLPDRAVFFSINAGLVHTDGPMVLQLHHHLRQP
jgi:hypothetical protein